MKARKGVEVLFYALDGASSPVYFAPSASLNRRLAAPQNRSGRCDELVVEYAAITVPTELQASTCEAQKAAIDGLTTKSRVTP